MRAIRDVIKWSLVGVLLVLPESGFTRIHQSPLMESQGVCLECEQLTLFDGLQQQTEELLHPVQHGPRVYRTPVAPKRRLKVRSKVAAKLAPKRSPKPTVFRGSQLRTPAQPRSGSAIMAAIARAARSGAGSAPRGYCYAGVKKILRAAGLPWLPGASAFQAASALKNIGFRNDMSRCLTEGTIRVYRGPGSGTSEAQTRRAMIARGVHYTAGDYHGHVEVVGGNGRFYYNAGGADHPIDANPSSRRTLIGCFVK